jgi:hypothetical protein
MRVFGVGRFAGEEMMHRAFVESWKEITATCTLRHPNILRFERVFVHHKR